MIIFRTLIIRDAHDRIIDTIELPPIEREPTRPWHDADSRHEIVTSEEKRPQ